MFFFTFFFICTICKVFIEFATTLLLFHVLIFLTVRLPGHRWKLHPRKWKVKPLGPPGKSLNALSTNRFLVFGEAKTSMSLLLAMFDPPIF